MPGFAPVQLAFFQAQSGIARNRSGDPKFSPQASSISGLRNSAEGPLRAEEFGLMSVLVLKDGESENLPVTSEGSLQC